MVRGQIAFLAALSLILSGCTISYAPESTSSTPTPIQSSQSPEPTREPSPAPTETQAAKSASNTAAPAQESNERNNFEYLLAALQIEAEQGLGYDRDLFRHWIDADGDGCNTRREVLIQESQVAVSITGDCQVSGQWISLFDLVSTTDASTFDVDHMVPLKEAWDSGAHSWNTSTRTAFANDLGYPHSLIAVTARSNRSKSDRDPSQWLPPNSSFHCEYGYRWVAVKYRWSLSIDSEEALALGRLAAKCSDEAFSQMPTKATVIAGPPPQAPSPRPTSDRALDPRFGTCREAIANGYGNYIRGVDPEYAWYRDGDSDGIVCE
jgi:hypothetical protein